MIAFSIWLTGLALSDVVASFSGAPRRERVLGALLAGALVVVIESIAFGLSAGDTLLLVAFSIAVSGGWIWSRMRIENGGTAPAALALTYFLIALLISAVVCAGIDSAPRSAVTEMIAGLPFPRVSATPLPVLNLVLGVILAQVATANGVVRLVLAAAGSLPKDEPELSAGRMIGPIERLLIFGLGLSGEPTAAAFVASAKSLLRFPELGPDRDATSPSRFSEYVVLGSLASWLCAAAPLVLFVSS